MISSTGLPYAYDQFKDGTQQAPPFICFYYGASNDLYADGINYQRIDSLTIEFYSDCKDIDKELQIEAVLMAAGLPFAKYEQSLEDEKMHETVYELQVLITQEDINE